VEGDGKEFLRDGVIGGQEESHDRASSDTVGCPELFCGSRNECCASCRTRHCEMSLFQGHGTVKVRQIGTEKALIGGADCIRLCRV
jgi:hypothetical protein